MYQSVSSGLKFYLEELDYLANSWMNTISPAPQYIPVMRKTIKRVFTPSYFRRIIARLSLVMLAILSA
jgi:hypothetical protein